MSFEIPAPGFDRSGGSSTPTAHDILHTEAVNIATDAAAMLLEYRGLVGGDEAFLIANEVLTLADRIGRARISVTTPKAREHFAAARTICLRTMIAFERLGARSRIPLVRSANLHDRLSSLATALGALSEDPGW